MTERAQRPECESLFPGMALHNGGPGHKKKDGITRSQLLDLLQQQNYRCALSGVALTPETASIDHKIPVQQGGSHSIENLHIVEHKVNWAKGTMTVDEFVEMCRRVVAHQEGRALSQRKEKDAQVP